MSNGIQTTLSVLTDLAQLAGLDKMVKSIFNVKTVKPFNAEINATNALLKTNAQHLADIVRQMDGVGRATQKWKDLKKEMSEVNAESSQLRATLSSLGGSKGGGGGGFGGGGGGGGWQQQLRGASAATQLPTPGLGGFGQMLSAVPVAGVMAAGAMMNAYSQYGSYLQYEQARLAAAPHLMRSGDLMGYRGGSRGFQPAAFSSYATSLGFTEADQGALAANAGRWGTGFLSGAGGSVRAGIGAGDTAGRLLASGLLDTNIPGQMIGGSRGAIGRGLSALTRFGGQAFGGGVGLFAAPVAGTISAAYNTATGFEGPGAPTYGPAIPPGHGAFAPGATADWAGYSKAGLRYGYNPQQSIGMAGGLASAAGRDISADEFSTAAALERLGGISTGVTGGFMRASRYTQKDGVSNMGSVADFAFGGYAGKGNGGLGMSEIVDELEKQTQWLSGLYSQGVEGATGMGFRAMAGMRDAGVGDAFRQGSMTRGYLGQAASIGMNGANTAMDMQMMMAQGYSGSGGAEGYFGTLNDMQDMGKSEGGMINMLNMIKRRVAGMSPQMARAMALRQMRGAGMQGASLGVADQLLGAQNPLALGDMQGVNLGDLQGSAEGLTNTLGGATKAEAGLEGRAIQVGGEVAQSMLALKSTAINLAGTFNNTFGPAISRASELLDAFSATLESATEGSYGVLRGGG